MRIINAMPTTFPYGLSRHRRCNGHGWHRLFGEGRVVRIGAALESCFGAADERPSIG